MFAVRTDVRETLQNQKTSVEYPIIPALRRITSSSPAWAIKPGLISKQQY
jgi:hypothetical protein